jgi:hypothetical protein
MPGTLVRKWELWTTREMSGSTLRTAAVSTVRTPSFPRGGEDSICPMGRVCRAWHHLRAASPAAWNRDNVTRLPSLAIAPTIRGPAVSGAYRRTDVTADPFIRGGAPAPG